MTDSIENTDEATEVAPTPTEGDISDATPDEGRVSDVDPEGSEDSEPDDDSSLSRRDIRYREKLRATEAERDTLRQNLEAMQRREVERLAAEHLTKPAALWSAGVELASLVGEDGTVDPDRVIAAAQDARQQLGLEDPRGAKLRGPVVPREGTSVASGGKSSSWTAAFER